MMSPGKFIVMMAAFMASVAISIDAMLPALDIIGRDLAVADINHTQYILVLIFGGMAIGQLLCGPASDALGRKKVLYAGLALFAAGSLVSMLAPNFAVMLIGRFMQGLGVAGPYVSAVAIIRDRHSGAEMARIMSFVMMIFVLVPSIAPALGQGILFVANWRWIFGMLLGCAVLLAIWVYASLPETLPPEKRLRLRAVDLWMGFREVFANRTTTGYMVCMGLTFGSFMGYLNSTRQIFQDQFETGPMFSAYFGGLALVFGLSSLCNASIVRRFGMRRLCQSAAGAIILSSMAFLAWCHLWGEALWPFLAYVSVLYFAMGLMFGNLNAIAMEPMGHVAGIASAVIGATSSVISLCLGTLIGQLYDGTLAPVTTGFLILSACCLLLMRRVEKRHGLAAVGANT
jgi:DHA1 family bicyclomycin/chloramphenicol resistance-like MFS transporter